MELDIDEDVIVLAVTAVRLASPLLRDDVVIVEIFPRMPEIDVAVKVLVYAVVMLARPPVTDAVVNVLTYPIVKLPRVLVNDAAVNVLT